LPGFLVSKEKYFQAMPKLMSIPFYLHIFYVFEFFKASEAGLNFNVSSADQSADWKILAYFVSR
jgi:hypothetical protein